MAEHAKHLQVRLTREERRRIEKIAADSGQSLTEVVKDWIKRDERAALTGTRRGDGPDAVKREA